MTAINWKAVAEAMRGALAAAYAGAGRKDAGERAGETFDAIVRLYGAAPEKTKVPEPSCGPGVIATIDAFLAVAPPASETKAPEPQDLHMWNRPGARAVAAFVAAETKATKPAGVPDGCTGYLINGVITHRISPCVVCDPPGGGANE